MADERTAAQRLVRRALIGLLEIGARAASKAVESAVGDVRREVQKVEENVKAWRETELGEVEERRETH